MTDKGTAKPPQLNKKLSPLGVYLVTKDRKLIKKMGQEKKRLLDLIINQKGKIVSEEIIEKARKICSRKKDI